MSYRSLRESNAKIDHRKHIEQILGTRSSRTVSFVPKEGWIEIECSYCQTTLYRPKWALRENNYCDQVCSHNAQKRYKTTAEKYRAYHKRRKARWTPEKIAYEKEMQRKRYKKYIESSTGICN